VATKQWLRKFRFKGGKGRVHLILLNALQRTHEGNLKIPGRNVLSDLLH
jgi:hypothetical protein